MALCLTCFFLFVFAFSPKLLIIEYRNEKGDNPMNLSLIHIYYIDLITCPVKGYDEHHNLIGFEYNVVTVKDSEFVSLGAYATPVK